MPETLTVEQIMRMAKKTEPFRSRPGCHLLRPPVPLIFKETGELVEVEAVDLNGKYAGMVHVHELGFWRSTNEFKLKN